MGGQIVSQIKLINDDCIAAMKAMPDNSIDSIVTDPPYELGFMGKSWDSSGIAFNVAVWTEALRVLKPGGHLIAFSGSRTYHRMAVAIEDAGFEIRDQIMWVYGSGFPKSMDISKQIDKNNGEPNRLLKFTSWMRTTGLKAKDIDLILRKNDLISQTSNMAVHFFNDGQPQIATAQMWEVIRPLIAEVPEWIDELVQRIEAEREVTGMHQNPAAAQIWMQNYGLAENAEAKERRDIPSTPAAKQWQGWGTALKPAHEPMVLARKPVVGTVANNVLTYGVGGLNIDASRVEGDKGTGNWKGVTTPDQSDNIYAGGWDGSVQSVEPITDDGSIGRWPANFIHDGLETEWAKFFYCAKTSKRDRNEGLDGFEAKQVFGDKGGTYQGLSNSKVPDTNHHPTVKPTSLMQYLVRLVTPQGGTVLDPFMGSGSTGKACAYEGFDFVGIDQSLEYVEIAKARINFALENLNADI